MEENKTFDEKEYITKMYESALESQKQGLQQDYDQNQAALDEQRKKLQKQTDANLNRTYVEAAKDKQNYNEVQNAYGLSSGAMGQARLAQDNQLQADLTALRAAQQTAEAGIEQERGILAKEYAAAIRKAQADSDLAKVQALYEQAQKEEERLLAKQEAAANLMAGQGDYSRLAALYGLTAEDVAKLSGQGNYSDYVPVEGPEGPEDPDGYDEPATYDSILRKYLGYKKAGVPGRELDALLSGAISDGTITQAQATEIRNTRYEV